MIQPKTSNIKQIKPELHEVGCLGKITSFRETEDGRFLIEIKGLIRFRKITELSTENKYRVLEVDFKNFYQDLEDKKENLKFSDLELIFKDLKASFLKRAEGDTFFICNHISQIDSAVQRVIESNKRVNIEVPVVATVPEKFGSEPVAEFVITLSMKQK